MCAKCEEDYFKLFEKCHECIGACLTILVITIIGIVWYVINVTVSRNVSSVEMILSWAQLTNIIGDVKLDWPNKLKALFSVASILDFDVDILEPSCLISSWSYTQNLIIQLCLPFLMSGVAAFIFLLSYFLYKLHLWHFDNIIHFTKVLI